MKRKQKTPLPPTLPPLKVAIYRGDKFCKFSVRPDPREHYLQIFNELHPDGEMSARMPFEFTAAVGPDVEFSVWLIDRADVQAAENVFNGKREECEAWVDSWEVDALGLEPAIMPIGWRPNLHIEKGGAA